MHVALNGTSDSFSLEGGILAKSKRQFPSPKYFLSLIDWGWPTLDRGKFGMERALTVADMAKLAQRRVPKAVFDYVDGSALDEISVDRSRNAFHRIEFKPQALHDVSQIDPSTEIFGKKIDLPIIFAPTGYTRFMHHTGELAVAEVAAAKNLIYSLSTMGTTSPKELAEAVPEARRWFQLYLMKNRENSLSIINQARENGFEALILTVDTPISGIRLRDIRNGLTIPPRIRFGTLLAIARKPRWWINLLTMAPLEFAAFSGWNKSLFELASVIFDPSMTYEDVSWLQSVWEGQIIVKGVQNKEDAMKLAKLGVQGIVLSNHGGRQLDRGPVPLEVLEDVVNAVGEKVDVYIDGGILSGQDIYAAVALGAKAVLIGRAYLYGIMADGQRGVDKVIEILKSELINTMALTGARNISEVRSIGVRIRPNN